MNNFLFTSESVSIGHPDKIADQISDAILDACLKTDPDAKVACETLVSRGLVVLAGEISAHGHIDYQEVARQTIREIGYDTPALGFDYRSCGVIITINKQSPDIARGVNENQSLYKEQGAGDQGLMFGYACDETPELMPLPIMLAHGIVRELRLRRQQGLLKYLRPDAKSQVTVEYNEHYQPVRIHTVVISTQHAENVDHATIIQDMKSLVKDIFPEGLLDADTIYYINPTGRFVEGGPAADCGLTGRKIIVDTYGGMGRHGGGAFSGKDPSKVDRSASYAARYVAKNIVAAQLAKRCEIQISYAIGVPFPISIKVDTFGTSQVNEDLLSRVIPLVFNLTPKGIIEMLDLKRPIFRKTAFEGHFGREEKDFTWEKTDRVQALLDAIKQESFILRSSHKTNYSFPHPPPFISKQEVPLLTHAQTTSLYTELEQKLDVQEEKAALMARLKQQLKRSHKYQDRLKNDLSTCLKWKEVHQEGELLKANFSLLKRGLNEVKVWDWIQEKEMILLLNPAWSAQEQIADRFKKSKKLQKGIINAQTKLAKIQQIIESLQQALDYLENINSSSELKELKEKWAPEKSIAKAKVEKKSVVPSSPYYEYESAKGIKIWVGKNAKQNDKLTFHLAKGSDWWLHVRDFAGSHVIIKTTKNQEPDQETLWDAMQLALQYSQAKNQGEAEICLTQKKFVSRFGKGQVGKVHLSKHKVLLAKIDPVRFQELKARKTNPHP